jgi:tetratricopeptide (TPR) repeat protein
MALGHHLVFGLPNRDPTAVHEQLREKSLKGLPTAPLVNAWIQQTGDHSFDSFLVLPGKGLRAILLQERAYRFWEQQQLETAAQLYREAATHLKSLGLLGEAAFCLYFYAEILAEKEHFSTSLASLNEALSNAQRYEEPQPYLVALIEQSRGYNLWFLGYLRASAEAFAEAQQGFLDIAYQEGIVTSWANLAVLSEELQMANQADRFYRQAIEEAEGMTEPSILFQLHANYALFLSKLGRGASREPTGARQKEGAPADRANREGPDAGKFRTGSGPCRTAFQAGSRKQPEPSTGILAPRISRRLCGLAGNKRASCGCPKDLLSGIRR